MQTPIVKLVDRFKELSDTEKEALNFIFINEQKNKEINASKLAKHLDVELSTVSKTLKELKNCGLISTRRIKKQLNIETSSPGRELAELSSKKRGSALVIFL